MKRYFTVKYCDAVQIKRGKELPEHVYEFAELVTDDAMGGATTEAIYCVQVKGQNDARVVKHNDWLVYDQNGKIEDVVSNAKFKQDYRPATALSKAIEKGYMKRFESDDVTEKSF